MALTGYSGKPLAQKLGLKDGQAVAFAGLPASLDYLATCREFASMEKAERWNSLLGKHLDYVHLFTDSATIVGAATPDLRERIKPSGMVWISWPKKASKVPTDVTEDVIRRHALADILVDVKVCAVDNIWSGLKLMIRKEKRTGAGAG